MSTERDDLQFSKTRLEMLCDGVFTVAMTLLILELKPPNLPREAAPQEILHALGEREHILGFVGYFMTFGLASGFWILHHIVFHHIRRVNYALTVLTIPFLMFVAFLPFSMSMLTSFSIRQPVGLGFYFGNLGIMASLLAIQWRIAGRRGLLEDVDNPRMRRFGLVLSLQPFAFAVAFLFVFIAPSQAMEMLMFSEIAISAFARRRSRAPQAKTAGAGSR